MSDVVNDGAGVLHAQPVEPPPYEDRMTHWIQLALVVIIVALGYLFVQFNRRAGLDPDQSFAKVWLDYYDTRSTVYESRIAPALDAVIDGGSAELGDLFFYFTYPEPNPLGLDQAALSRLAPGSNLVDAAQETIDQSEAWAIAFDAPAKAEIIRFACDWDRRIVAGLSIDGTSVTDMSLLRDARDSDVLEVLHQMEADALPLLQRDYDAVRFSQRFAALARWGPSAGRVFLVTVSSGISAPG